MNAPRPTMIKPTSAAAPIHPIAMATPIVLPASPWHTAACGSRLTPYEAAAKSIFIKANGLAAYYRSSGIVQGTD